MENRIPQLSYKYNFTNISIYLTLTIILLCIYAYIYFRTKKSPLDPGIIMDSKLTQSQKLKLSIHAPHHDEKDIKNLVKLLENGKEWHEAHSTLKPLNMSNHLSHMDSEMSSLLIESMTITVGLLFAFTMQTIADIFAPTDNKILAAWYYSICFLFMLLFFGFLIMGSKHYLSFRTWKMPNY